MILVTRQGSWCYTRCGTPSCGDGFREPDVHLEKKMADCPVGEFRLKCYHYKDSEAAAVASEKLAENKRLAPEIKPTGASPEAARVLEAGTSRSTYRHTLE